MIKPERKSPPNILRALLFVRKVVNTERKGLVFSGAPKFSSS